MKHYYYKFEVYDDNKKRWIKKHGFYVTENEHVIDNEYFSSRFGFFKVTKLVAIFYNDDLIYGSL